MAKTTSGQSDRQRHEELMKSLQVGSSFFLENVLPQDCNYIRRLGYKLGYKLAIRLVTQDEIYGTEGTRVLRRA